ncbi:MAG: S1 RNA-binding domain-containing protein [Clostridiales bacterium]|nr:S1 RNA-binding domain-containing protein [Clostridiales bacterium]
MSEDSTPQPEKKPVRLPRRKKPEEVEMTGVSEAPAAEESAKRPPRKPRPSPEAAEAPREAEKQPEEKTAGTPEPINPAPPAAAMAPEPAEAPAAIEEGRILEGKITKIKPFGALVQLPGNIHGLVHISHISSAYVQNIEEYVSIGDTVKVKVLAVDTKLNKISLSMKEAQDSPPPKRAHDQGHHVPTNLTFEDKLKEYTKISSERLAGLNKRNKKR